MIRPFKSASKNAAYALKQRLTIEHITTKTSVFKCPIGQDNFDPATAKIVQKQFELWFKSWVEDDINIVVAKLLS